MGPTRNGKRLADETDHLVGRRLRALRKAAKLSQPDLAEPLGLSFQQLQKYEAGTNRISAGKLAAAAEVLDVPIDAFFREPSFGEQAKASLAADKQEAISLLQSTTDADLVEAALKVLKQSQKRSG